jgi:hypothetical protein
MKRRPTDAKNMIAVENPLVVFYPLGQIFCHLHVTLSKSRTNLIGGMPPSQSVSATE